MMPQTVLLISTRKGLWTLRSESDRADFRLEGPQHLGHIVHHTVLDPRDGRTLLAAVRTGHLGPALLRSVDGGKTWKESAQPPAFPKGEPRARAVDHVFWLTPGHTSQPGVWYAGTSPQGLFRSEDGGVTWTPVSGYNDHPDQATWAGGDKDQTPDGGKLHSILVDPRDARHLYVGMSGGGFFESKDEGATWQPFSRGVENQYLPKLPDGQEHTFGDDPHCVALHPLRPDRLWQQNHFGIYRLDRDQSERWTRVGRAMPAEVGDIGFVMVLHPREPDTAWVFPMDGTDVWPRTSPGGKPALYMTRDGGESWSRQDGGLPKEQAWWTVKRQAMTADAHDPVGLYLGTTSGEVWASVDEGRSFSCIARHLPEIYAVTVG
ncbi:MAG TPA: sialidase family protein [Labilithrix sp.]|nr:sialidase family protein [Labilithrix sp.]